MERSEQKPLCQWAEHAETRNTNPEVIWLKPISLPPKGLWTLKNKFSLSARGTEHARKHKLCLINAGGKKKPNSTEARVTGSLWEDIKNTTKVRTFLSRRLYLAAISAYQTSLVSVRIPIVATLPKNTKNKLFAITAVPMGTHPRRVCPLQHSSAQTVCEPIPQHATQTGLERKQKRAGGGGGWQSLPLQEPGPLTESHYRCERLAGFTCEKCHKGKKDPGPQMLCLQCSLPLHNTDHTLPGAAAARGWGNKSYEEGEKDTASENFSQLSGYVRKLSAKVSL